MTVARFNLMKKNWKTTANTYWIVLGAAAPKKPYRHSTKPEAITEAIRLAELHPDQVFTVCGAHIKFKKRRDAEVVEKVPLKEEL